MPRLVPALLLALVLAVSTSSSAAAGDGVGVFHDRVAKRDKADDVKGDSSRPVDIRRVVYDHYRTGSNERMVLTVRFADHISDEVALQWEIDTSGPYVSVRWSVGGGLRVTRDGERVPNRGSHRSVEGRVATLTLPWAKLGSPRKVTEIALIATYGVDGIDTNRTSRVLD